ncbi:MAG: glycosyltransferase family 39 protein [Gammaproteobacteria bacterium]|nr:glycosyltransferase family 39 protein [Gammaproteobacteria bacterium]
MNAIPFPPPQHRGGLACVSVPSAEAMAFPERVALGALLALAVGIIFSNAFTQELHVTSAFYAALAREIVTAGDPLEIFRGARAYLLKPPLVLWASAASMTVFGFNTFAATLPVRLAGVGCVWLTYLVGRRIFDRATAWYAAFMLVTLGPFFQFTVTFRMDPILTFGVLLSTWAYLAAAHRAAPFAFSMGIVISVLAKGPAALYLLVMLPVHAMVDPGCLAQARRWPLRWYLLLLIPVAWYAWLWTQHGMRPFTEVYEDFWRTSTAVGVSRYQSALEEYVQKPATRFLPWLPFILAGFVLACRDLRRAATPRAERAALLLLVTGIAVTIGVSITKPDHDIRYWYPEFPAMTLLAARPLARFSAGRLPRWIGRLGAALGILALLVATGMQVGNRLRTSAHLDELRAEVARGGISPAHTIVIGAVANPPEWPRRQNSVRDWIYFYLGVELPMMSWQQAQTADLSGARNFLVPRNRNDARVMREFGLVEIMHAGKIVLADLPPGAPKSLPPPPP